MNQSARDLAKRNRPKNAWRWPGQLHPFLARLLHAEEQPDKEQVALDSGQELSQTGIA